MILFEIFSIGFAHIGRVGSVTVTISIAIERYLGVCHPTTTFSYQYLLFPLPIIFTIFYNIPKFFEVVKCSEEELYHTMLIQLARHNTNNSTHDIDIFSNNTYKDNNNNNESLLADDDEEKGDVLMCDIYETRPTSLRNNKWYIILYVFLSEFILIEIVPWILVIILNIKTWKGIRKFQQKRQTLRNKPRTTQGKIYAVINFDLSGNHKN